MTWSHNVERCWSGGICSRITFGASTSMNTLSIIDTTSSPGSGYFQACNAGWPTFGFQVHLSHVALVLLEGGDFLGIRRPQQNGIVALGPAGIVQRIGVVPDAVRRELCLFAAGHVAHPQVVFPNKGELLTVGRSYAVLHAPAYHHALRALPVTLKLSLADPKRNELPVHR